jgi:hypothetical protein
MSSFPFTLGPLGSDFPMSGNPYWSRTTLSQIQGATAKNYAFLAFKPGLPLQASELNEIQEINVMNQTLTFVMISSWPAGSAGSYGPGWKGTTPLYPYFDGDNTTENMVGYTAGVVTVREGWYLVTIKSSGMKHWVYLSSGYTSSIPDIVGTNTQYLGFTAYYETVKPAQDPSLYDNSTGINLVTGAAAGADRIKITILPPFWTTDKSSGNFSPMIKKIDNDAGILFMNNIPVPIEG